MPVYPVIHASVAGNLWQCIFRRMLFRWKMAADPFEIPAGPLEIAAVPF